MSPHINNRQTGGARIVRLIEERIASGVYPPGSWLPAQRALAEEAGVDRSVVRKAIAELIARGVVIQHRGCRPVIGSAALPSPAPSAVAPATIGVIIYQQDYYSCTLPLMRGIQNTLSHAEPSVRMLVQDTGARAIADTIARQRRAIDEAIRDRIAGVILYAMGGRAAAGDIALLTAAGIPVVCVDRTVPGAVTDFVGVDDRIGARTAVGYLAGLGHARIGHVTAPLDESTVQERLAGYRDGLEAAGLLADESYIYAIDWFASPATQLDAAASYFISLENPPTALFVYNDTTAHRLINALEAKGIRVPDDMSICGFDDLDQYSPRPRRLTTMHIPFERIGEIATERLLERIAGQAGISAPSRHMILETSLVVSATTAPPRAAQGAS
ncbi:MAG: GntR family transcriptional regulator [Capsulimonadaceae bacterium]|nr:GntR family transcriptional regulator [Capsulimonadaceae bacterium]